MKNRLLMAGLVLAFLFSACSEDPASEDADMLTQEQVAELVQELGGRALSAIFRNGNAGKATRQIIIDETQACPDGGTVQVVGELAGETGNGSGTLTLDVDEILDDCGLDLDGQPYVINTVPALNGTGTVVVQQGTFQETQMLFLSGALSLQGSRGPALSCSLDLTLAVTVSDRSALVTGTACGVAVDVPLTYEP